MRITLDGIDDAKFRRIAACDDMAAFIWEFQQYLREQVRYGNPPDDIEKIYSRWFEAMEDNGVIIDKLWV